MTKWSDRHLCLHLNWSIVRSRIADECGGPPPVAVRREQALGAPETAAAQVLSLASEAAADMNGEAIGTGGDLLNVWAHQSGAAMGVAGCRWSGTGAQAARRGGLVTHALASGNTLPTILSEEAHA